MVVERFLSAIGATFLFANLPTLRSKLPLLMGTHYIALLANNWSKSFSAIIIARRRERVKDCKLNRYRTRSKEFRKCGAGAENLSWIQSRDKASALALSQAGEFSTSNFLPWEKHCRIVLRGKNVKNYWWSLMGKCILFFSNKKLFTGTSCSLSWIILWYRNRAVVSAPQWWLR
jgi:hypothetical protein